MTEPEIVSDLSIKRALKQWSWGIKEEEGRLMLVELILKASAGYRSSHTEEGFLREFNLLKKDRTPNKKGREFLCSMLYKHSNLRPPAYRLMWFYRS